MTDIYHKIKITYVDDPQFMDDFQLACADLLVTDYDKNMGHSVAKFAQVFKAMSLIFPDFYSRQAVKLLREVINKDIDGLYKTSIAVLESLKKMDGKQFEIEIKVKEIKNNE